MFNRNIIFNGFMSFIIFTLFSCQSNESAEYEVLNVVIDKCVFVPTDIKELSKIAEEKKVDLSKALEMYDIERKDNQYTFSISDTLAAVDLPKDTWNGLHGRDIFEVKGKSDQPIPVDFQQIKPLENRKRIKKSTENDLYLGHFKFHRVLFDNSKSQAYVQVDISDAKNRLFTNFGILLKKVDGKWKINQ
jgi:hypothetical protein